MSLTQSKTKVPEVKIAPIIEAVIIKEMILEEYLKTLEIINKNDTKEY